MVSDEKQILENEANIQCTFRDSIFKNDLCNYDI